MVDAVRRGAEAGGSGLTDLANALLSSGALDERLTHVLEQHAQQHIESNATALAAEIDARVAAERRELEQLRRMREDLATEIEMRTREAQRKLREQLEDARHQHEQRLLEERSALDRERAQLETRARELTEHLRAVTTRFEAGQQQVIADFIAQAVCRRPRRR